MKAIILTFNTELGESVYKQIEEKGSQDSRTNKAITKTVFKEKTISFNPLVIEIKPKIKWLANQIDIIGQMKKLFSDRGIKEGLDYNLEVK